MNKRFAKHLGWIPAVLAALFVMWTWAQEPSERLIEKDGFQNLAMAYNFVQHGTMSLDEDKPPESLAPSRYREPLPVVVLSAFVLGSKTLHDAQLSDLEEGPGAKVIKFSNLFWGLLLIVIVSFATWRMTGWRWMAAPAILISCRPFTNDVDTLYTEIAAAAILALASYLCWRALRLQTGRAFFIAGLGLGAYVLTKASFLYVFAAVIVVYIVSGLLYVRDKEGRRRIWRFAALTVVGTALFCSPWMVRNQIQFGSPEIADRGGSVLWTRAVKNGMTWDEYRGMYFLYAPWPFRPYVGIVVGYKQSDLYEGNALQRLRRNTVESDKAASLEGRVEDTVSYYHRAKAVRMRTQLELQAAGHPNPIHEADERVKQMAIEAIKADPLKHLAMTPVFLLRGAGYMFPFLALMLIYAWRRRDGPLAAFLMPSLGLIGFYALLSHFIPRYADPSWPIVAICLMLLLQRGWEKMKARRARVGKSEAAPAVA
jgi:hypothetical protein